MEKSKLYDLLERAIIQNWRESAEKDLMGVFEEQEKKTKSELLDVLSDKYKGVLLSYGLTVEDRLDFLHYNLHVKILNLGIQLGMELQKSFIADDDA